MLVESKRAFIDTNVLIYFAARDPAKAMRARSLLTVGTTISVQVLNEFTNVARRKLAMSWDETHEFLGLIRRLLTVLPLTERTHQLGVELAQHDGLSLYDAMIVAAALEAGCSTLWSEDMQHGRVVQATLTITNPFS